MTDTNNTWPGKPGVPLNPEQNGAHWVKSALTGEVYLFNWKAGKFWSCGQPQILPHWVGHPMWQVKEMIYLGPCLTPDEATALQARVAELEKALKRWIEADDKGDGHECIHALSDARKLVEGKKDE